jgi:phosphoenolpyruvate carboxykinase (ATP)
MLGEKITKHGSRVWLVNTGWTGGAFGVGHRMKLSYTRAMLRAALDGKLDEAPTTKDPIFGLEIPNECPDVPSEILVPRRTWKDPERYDAAAHKLAGMFKENFEKFDEVPEEVKRAGP